MNAVPTTHMIHAPRRVNLAIMTALASLCLATSMSAEAQLREAPPYAQGNYLEALGSRVQLAPSPTVISDDNPLLNDTGGGNDGQFSSTAPVHDGDVERLTNVGRNSNVPVPDTMGAQSGQQRVVAQNAPPSQPQPQAQPQFPAQQRSQIVASTNGGNVAQVEPLPSPKLDIPKIAVDRMAPANPEQVRRIVQELYQRQGAAVTPPNNNFIGRATQYTVDLSPGATPPVVRVARGVGATVSFVDSAGNPWPITFAKNFYAEATTVTQMAPHVLSVAANSPHLSGSVGVMLKGLTTPINFIASPAQAETDYRVDLQIPGLSPDAPPVPGAISNRPDISGGNLKDFLYGATPNGATLLKVTSGKFKESNTRAWQNSNGQLVIRTSAHVISPGWYNMQPALDGTAVYSLPATPVVRVSVDGREQTFMIDGLIP